MGGEHRDRRLAAQGNCMNAAARAAALPLLAAAVVLAVAAPTASIAAAARFRRGIGITAMAWAAIQPGPEEAFAFPPFVGPSYALTRDELQTLQHTGFDFIRLAVDPGPFLQFQGSQRDALDRILINRVKLILSCGLAVLVDFHPSDMHPDFTAQALTAGPRTPLFQSYLRMLQRTAVQLGQLHSDRVALELMNEPPISAAAWQPMLEAAYAAARSGSRDLTLVLEGGNEASMPALMKMTTAPFATDPAVFYSFHYYEPYQFTHQGASWNPARYLADVPYPARARPLDDSLTATAAAIAATDLSEPRKSLAYQDAQTRLEDYRTSGFDAETIAQDFAQIADWAKAHGVPAGRILLGEFGARETALQRDGARERERAQWFHDVSRAAQTEGFGWAVWAYRGGGGFALAQSDASNQIEPQIAAALGLRRPDAREREQLSAPRISGPMP
jgi:endoglucanase